MAENRRSGPESEAAYLAQYDPAAYPRPSVTVDMVVFTVTGEDSEYLADRRLRVLLVKRDEHPFRDRWALPGGFVGMDESLEAAAARVLLAKTHISDIYLEQLYTWGQPDRDPRTRVMSCSYLSLIDASALAPRAGAGTAAVQWFTIDEELLDERTLRTPAGLEQERTVRLKLQEGPDHCSATIRILRRVSRRARQVERELLEADGLAFDHAQILSYGLERLRTKLEWSDIAFSLMPEQFTLAELQQVYEVILGRKLLRAAFQRKVLPMLEETGGFTAGLTHRPARLYRFNPAWSGERL